MVLIHLNFNFNALYSCLYFSQFFIIRDYRDKYSEALIEIENW